MINEILKTKPANERATFKGQEIARVVSLGKTVRPNYDIEIVEIKAIEKGVELYARAWKDGKQIGFGKDGSVDMERFVIINPPILVPDVNGDIIREWTDEITQELKQRKLQENPQEALLQVLEHNLSVMKNIHGDEKIVVGKRGNTTTTVYPDAGTGSTTVDGSVSRVISAGEDFATIIAGVGTTHDDTGQFADAFSIAPHNSATDKWTLVLRTIYLFDTSAIADGDTISSATFSLLYNSKRDTLGITPDADIYTSTPASDNDLVNGDYGQIGSVSQTGTPKTFASWGAGYNDFTFNATGISNINKTGISKFGLRNANYDVAASAPTWTSGKSSSAVTVATADSAGTTQDPKLVVEHSVASTFTPTVMIF